MWGEGIIAFCSVVAFNSELKDAEQKLGHEISEINHNKSQYRGCSQACTTKTLYLGFGIS